MKAIDMFSVELISNISHYYHTALALQEAGYLGYYTTGPCALESERWMGRLGKPFVRLWNERRLEGIPSRKVRRMWLPEIVQKGVKCLGGTGEQSNWIHNELFSHRAASMIGECDALHFVHSVGREAARKAKRNGAKVICDMREEHPQFQHDILSDEAARLGIDFTNNGVSYTRRVLDELALADKILCPSAYAKKTFVAHGIDADKISICPYGVDNENFTSSRDERRTGQFTVLFLGGICMRKGIQYLLEGYKQAELKNARLLLAGPVDLAFRPILQKYAGLFEEIGRVPHSQVPSLYRQADVFVIPSLADSYALVALEAMSAGLPVIVSENTGAAGIVRPNIDGFVVPIRDARAIADHLTYLNENSDKRAEMGASAAQRVKDGSWGKYRQNIIGSYDDLFGAGRGCSNRRHTSVPKLGAKADNAATLEPLQSRGPRDIEADSKLNTWRT